MAGLNTKLIYSLVWEYRDRWRYHCHRVGVTIENHPFDLDALRRHGLVD